MMNFLRAAAVAIAVFSASPALAATCFWVGGTGSWSTSNTASWASATGGTAGTCAATGGIPKQSLDNATFDANSGGGTVTVGSTMNGATIGEVIMGAFTGTLDFSANNPSMTFNQSSTSFSVTGTGVRTLNMGSGTFTLSALNGGWDATVTTNLTFNAGTSTICMCFTSTGARQAFTMGGLTYSTIKFGGTSGNNGAIVNVSGGTGSPAYTITNMTVTAPIFVGLPQATGNITNLTISGTSSANVAVLAGGNSTAAAPLVLGSSITTSWTVFKDVAISGSSLTASNSIDAGGNSGITFASTPGGNGAPPMIGGL